MGVLPFSSKASSMEKQPLPTACFEDAFLEYLRLRFEVEPLPHYAFAAMHLCDEEGRDYPQFVRSFMVWFTDRFLFEEPGIFPAQGTNHDKANDRWRRYEDCHALLSGWYNNDLKAALEEQADRLELVEEVQRLRLQERDDPAGKDQRRRKKSTMTDAEVFEKVANWFGEREHTLNRKFKKLAEPRNSMSGLIPIALVKDRGLYGIRCLKLAPEGEIWLSAR